jgi:uncharacterized membrane protein YeaQ/YmgE (transglycosylase-associated protein family)
MGNIIVWLILGLVAGALAKFIMPGKDPGGCLITIALGIAGAFVGGWLGNMLGVGAQVGGFNITSIVTATLGAIVLLAIYRLILGRKS